ncbi:MAG: DNA-binding protein [Dehalococcoidia bacterium]|jgi:hypothetical protein|nr:MAG: DNA-binding protein [Dehalococcoidia bacterium]
MTHDLTTSAPLDRWLPLAQAARLCGVHPVTLRVWADRGLVPAIRTAGGHRRFSVRALQERLSASATVPEGPLFQHGLDVTRERLGHAPSAIATRFDESERDRRRAEGRVLLGLVMHYAGSPDEEPTVIEEARRTGERYAAACLAVGMPLAEAVATALFFRDALVESAIDTPPGVKLSAADRMRVVGRINRVMNAYQLGLIERYEAER